MKNNQNKAFTIVETLVAISVLMIAIAGPLTVANKAYTAALDARNQSAASFLAQEGLEYINNVKDNNLWTGGAVWKYGVVGPAPAVFTTCSSGCSDSSLGTGLLALPTNFGRTYTFTTISGDVNQILVTVTVTWKTGTLNGSTQLQEILTDYER